MSSRTPHTHTSSTIRPLRRPTGLPSHPNGAAGEDAADIDQILQDIPLTKVVHGLPIPKAMASIAHVMVCPGGVYVVETKRFPNGRPVLRTAGGLLRPRTEHLMVGTIDRTSLLLGIRPQVQLVRSALTSMNASASPVPVSGALCFLEADWTVSGGDFVLDEVLVLGLSHLADLAAAPGPLTEARIRTVVRQLHRALPERGETLKGSAASKKAREAEA